MSLIERIRKARQSTVDIGNGKTLICRRPTDLEMLDMRGAKVTQGDILKRFVDGWTGFKEVDLVPGGSGDEVKFDAELFGEWISDHPEHWSVVSDAVVNGYKAHQESLEDATKN